MSTRVALQRAVSSEFDGSADCRQDTVTVRFGVVGAKMMIPEPSEFFFSTATPSCGVSTIALASPPMSATMYASCVATRGVWSPESP